MSHPLPEPQYPAVSQPDAHVGQPHARVRQLQAQLESERAEHIAQANRIKDLERMLRTREDDIDQLADTIIRQADAYRKLKGSTNEEIDRITATHRDEYGAAGRALAAMQQARESLQAQVRELNEQLQAARVEKLAMKLESMTARARAAEDKWPLV